MNPAQRNSPRSETFSISAEEAGGRLDHFLAARLPGFSRSRIQAVVKDGRVLLNGLPTKMAQKLRAGDEVIWHEPAPVVCETAEPSDIPLDILFEDKFLLVINKATGLVVHPGAGHRQGTLVSALLRWVDEGAKPTPEGIAQQCPAFEARFGKGCAFLPAYRPAPLESRVYPRERP